MTVSMVMVVVVVVVVVMMVVVVVVVVVVVMVVVVVTIVVVVVVVTIVVVVVTIMVMVVVTMVLSMVVIISMVLLVEGSHHLAPLHAWHVPWRAMPLAIMKPLVNRNWPRFWLEHLRALVMALEVTRCALLVARMNLLQLWAPEKLQLVQYICTDEGRQFQHFQPLLMMSSASEECKRHRKGPVG